MNKALVIAAVVLASTSAFASKARVNSLGNAAHLNDVRDVLSKPDKAAAYGEWALFEMGPTAHAAGYTLGTTNAITAEGGFVRMMGNSAMGAYLGNDVVSLNTYRATGGTAAGGTFLTAENPINVFYATKADLSWGVGLYHTSSKNKLSSTAERKQEAMAVNASVSTDVWDAQLSLGLSNTATDKVAAGERKLTGKSTTVLSGGYKMDTMYIYGGYSMGGASAETTASVKAMDRSDNEMKVGIVNSHKKDGTDFFYGIEYKMQTLKDDADTPAAASLGVANASKREITSMPIVVGIEAEAASWMVLRGAIKQDFNLLGMNKTKVSIKNNADADTETTGADNTVASAGIGLKWGKFVFDGTLATATNNTGIFGLDGANFMAQSALTYTF